MKRATHKFPDQDRRALLRGRLRARTAIRPPWSLSEPEFLSQCSRCGDCISACQEGILVTGDGGFPEVDFARGGCVLCGDCVEHCQEGAFLQPPHRTDLAWRHRVSLKGNCIAARGVVCRTCGDVCEERAIHFKLRVGGAALPLLDETACTGCGECIAVCPVQAVQIEVFPD